ncbi:phosphotransferase [Paenibacillus dendritiformis]|uniref:phosphotransferase enzyme family protein n=1 Tax=Paenibacillus TaxID=44249 RepID=UPI00248AD7E5|nr:phosphotransferase [Paenibacillus dendritiformis]WGU93041.1 phosphotransferase [Paenibacillus dendritiformis]
MEQQVISFLNENYPLHIHTAEAVTNEMYRCIGDQGTYYARVTNYKPYEEQLEEVSWTNALYREGVGVAPAIPSCRGQIVELMPPKDIIVVVYKAAPGIHLPRAEWNAEVLAELGRQIGRMHRITQSYEANHPLHHLGDWHDQEEYNFAKYIPAEETAIRAIAANVLAEVKKLPRERATYGLIHGDLWLENILVDRGSSLTMIDFQDCEKHYYMYDMAVPLYSALEFSFAGAGNIRDYGRSIANALIEGYQEEHTLNPEMLKQLPLFLKLKEIFEYNLMHMYWDRERLSEEQIRIMNLYRLRIEHHVQLLEWD